MQRDCRGLPPGPTKNRTGLVQEQTALRFPDPRADPIISPAMAHFEDDRQGRGKVLTKTRSKTRLARPRLYKVLLHNDDFTPREFVVVVLRHVFHRTESDATRLMLHVHNHGVGVAGLYPFSVAETKVAEVVSLAQQAEVPLLCTMEPEDDKGDGGGDDGVN